MPRSIATNGRASPPWPGYGARGTLVLPLPGSWLESLPPLLEVDGVVLGRKSEAHLTLLDRKAAAQVRRACAEAVVRAAFLAQDWSMQATGERWLLRKDLPSGRTAHALITMVDAPGFAAFRAALGRACGVELPEAMAHVTLYVAGKPTGIGLPDVAAFHRLRVKRVDAGGAPQAS